MGMKECYYNRCEFEPKVWTLGAHVRNKARHRVQRHSLDWNYR